MAYASENQEAGRYLVLDLEATCSQDPTSIPREEMEIIEIGAVILGGPHLECLSRFQTFVQPIRHPQLSDFCRHLTGITQLQVSQAPLFPEALARLSHWMAAFPSLHFCCWGDYDARQLQQDCTFHQVPYPLGEHLNLRRTFSEYLHTRRRYDLPEALRALDLKPEGSLHRALDDALNTARIWQSIHPSIVK